MLNLLINTPELFAAFYANVSALPIDNSSMFIRSVTMGNDVRYGTFVDGQATYFRSVLASIADTLKAFGQGGFTYRDAILMSK